MNEDIPTRYESILKISPFEKANWNGQITVCFSHVQAGWVLLWIATTAYVQHLTIHLSDAFKPFPDLFHWLEEIVNDRFPQKSGLTKKAWLKLYVWFQPKMTSSR